MAIFRVLVVILCGSSSASFAADSIGSWAILGLLGAGVAGQVVTITQVASPDDASLSRVLPSSLSIASGTAFTAFGIAVAGDSDVGGASVPFILFGVTGVGLGVWNLHLPVAKKTELSLIAPSPDQLGAQVAIRF